MKWYVTAVVGIWAIIAGVGAVVALTGASTNPATIPFYVAPALIIAGGLGVWAIKHRRERRERTTTRDSMESALSTRARADTMVDALVIVLAAGLLMFFVQSAVAPLLAFIAVGIVLADFFIRYAVLLRRTRS